MRHFNLVLALLLSFFALVVNGAPGGAAASPAGVSFSESGLAICSGQNGDVAILFKDAVNLYGYQFEVKLSDPKLAELSASFINTWFNTTLDATVPAGWEGACKDGACKFAVAKNKAKNTKALNGGGPVAHLVISRKGNSGTGGVQTLSIQNLKLVNDKAEEISVARSVELTVKVCSYATLDVQVRYQWRDEPGAAGMITLRDSRGVFSPVAVPYDLKTGKASVAVPVWPGAEGSAYNVEIEGKEGFFTTVMKSVVIKDSGKNAVERMLPGGDADRSGSVDTLDLACVAGAFGAEVVPCGKSGQSDLSLDGKVDVLDLVMVSSNLGLAGMLEVNPDGSQTQVQPTPAAKPTATRLPTQAAPSPTATGAQPSPTKMAPTAARATSTALPPSPTQKAASPVPTLTASAGPKASATQPSAVTRTATNPAARPTASATPKK